MTAGLLAATVLAVFSTSAAAASYAWFDRPEAASANSHAAVSNDVYVRGFGWALGGTATIPGHIVRCRHANARAASARQAGARRDRAVAPA